MLRKRLPSCVDELPPVRLAELTVSCARLKVREPSLLTAFTRVELSELSPALFAQVLKSLASFGLTSAKALQDSISTQCQSRLVAEDALMDHQSVHNILGLDAHRWVVNVLEALGDTAEYARKHHGGDCPAFLGSTLSSAASPLADLCPLLGAREVADVYRSLRQLPPTLVMPRPGTGLLALHDALANRTGHLATVEAFGPEELTSVLFSQMCLYPQLWCDPSPDDESLANPSSVHLRAAWKALHEAWGAAAAVELVDEHPPTIRQTALLQMLFGRSRRHVQCT